jgi:hypothetical protein
MVSLVEIEEKAEKGLLSLSSHGDRFAYWLSQITSPFVVGMALLGYISLETAPSVTQALQWLTLISVGLAMPYGFIWWGVKRGKVTDIHVSRRSERLLPLVVGLMALCGMLVGLVMLDASRPVVATLVAILTSFALAALITQLARFKMSLHVDSAAGALIVCCLLVSPLFLVLSPLVVLIAWARYKLEAHFSASSSVRCGPCRGSDGQHVLVLWPPMMSYSKRLPRMNASRGTPWFIHMAHAYA